MTRSIEQLTQDDSGWAMIAGIIGDCPTDVQTIGSDRSAREAALVGLQVSTHSYLGALAWHCGLLVVDHGWIRILGAGTHDVEGLRIDTLNDPGSDSHFEGIICAYDALGGRFAIHGSGFPGAAPGSVLYWAPDTLGWTDLEIGHAALIDFLLSAATADFYRDLRWDGWEADTTRLGLGQAIAVYPFLWTKEGRRSDVTRSPVPLSEVIGVNEEAARQLR